MASQVLSGSSNPSYTNNTGQNVRVIINYMNSPAYPDGGTIRMSWAGISVSSSSNKVKAIGKNLAAGYFGNLSLYSYTKDDDISLPTEIMLAPSQTFSAVCGAYNIVIIPENG
jgi:hypothetical protein